MLGATSQGLAHHPLEILDPPLILIISTHFPSGATDSFTPSAKLAMIDLALLLARPPRLT